MNKTKHSQYTKLYLSRKDVSAVVFLFDKLYADHQFEAYGKKEKEKGLCKQ